MCVGRLNHVQCPFGFSGRRLRGEFFPGGDGIETIIACFSFFIAVRSCS